MPRRRLLLIAIPTVAVLGLAAWILLAFLAVRDQFGSWNITINDHGTLVAQGRLDLIADSWTPAFSATPPFLRFEATNLAANTTGHITLTADGNQHFGRTNPDPFDLNLISCTSAVPGCDGQLWINGRQHRELCTLFLTLDANTGALKRTGDFVLPRKDGDPLHIPADISR